MSYPEVTVVELPRLEGKLEEGRPVDLGGGDGLQEAITQGGVQLIVNCVQAKSQRVFELTWEGGRIPTGAMILGKEVSWTQHGRVTDQGGEVIGTYERLETSKGSGKQRMRIYVAAEDGHPDKK